MCHFPAPGCLSRLLLVCCQVRMTGYLLQHTPNLRPGQLGEAYGPWHITVQRAVQRVR